MRTYATRIRIIRAIRSQRPEHVCAYRGCAKQGTEPVAGTPVKMCLEHTLIDVTARLRAAVQARLS